MSELMELVDRLTMETHRVVHLTSGPVIAVVPPLLVELQEEISPSGEGGGGSGGSVGAGAPVALDLVVLLARIEKDVTHLVWLARSLRRGESLRPGRGLCERVRWAASVLDGSGDEAEMVKLARSWARQIEAVFDPPKVVPLWDKTCPVCEHARTPRWDEGQEDWVNVAALSVTMGRSTAARCGECGTEWRGEEIMGLAEKLGIPPAVLHLLAA